MKDEGVLAPGLGMYTGIPQRFSGQDIQNRRLAHPGLLGEPNPPIASPQEKISNPDWKVWVMEDSGCD